MGKQILKYGRILLTSVVSLVLAAVGAAALLLAIHVCRDYADAPPILLAAPEEATERLETMMEAVCKGDYNAAGQFMLGTPDFGAEEKPEDDLGLLLWDAYMQSMAYSLEGECYTTDEGLAQDITFTYLDITSVTGNLRQRSHALMEQRVAAATDMSEIYNSNNEYREDFVMAVLYDTAKDALREDARIVTVSVTVNMKYQDGTWWILPETGLLDAISGGILF